MLCSMGVFDVMLCRNVCVWCSVARVGRGAEALEARVAQNLPRRAKCESPNMLPRRYIIEKTCVIQWRKYRLARVEGTLQVLPTIGTCSNPASFFFFTTSNFFFTMSDIDNANLEQQEQSEAAHFVWHILLLQITLMLGKAAPRMFYENFLLFQCCWFFELFMIKESMK